MAGFFFRSDSAVAFVGIVFLSHGAELLWTPIQGGGVWRARPAAFSWGLLADGTPRPLRRPGGTSTPTAFDCAEGVGGTPGRQGPGNTTSNI